MTEEYEDQAEELEPIAPVPVRRGRPRKTQANDEDGPQVVALEIHKGTNAGSRKIHAVAPGTALGDLLDNLAPGRYTIVERGANGGIVRRRSFTIEAGDPASVASPYPPVAPASGPAAFAAGPGISDTVLTLLVSMIQSNAQATQALMERMLDVRATPAADPTGMTGMVSELMRSQLEGFRALKEEYRELAQVKPEKDDEPNPIGDALAGLLQDPAKLMQLMRLAQVAKAPLAVAPLESPAKIPANGT